MEKIKIVHIDDDASFLDYFKRIVEQEPFIEYMNGFTNVVEAFHYLQDQAPDIIFTDVEMPEHNGFWLAERIKHLQSDVVFVTSHIGYALQAFEVCAVDYLVKPITESKFFNFIERYRTLKKKKNEVINEQIKEVLSNYIKEGEIPARIFINTAGKIDIINLKDVLYFSSKGNYTEVHTSNNAVHISGKSIKTYEEAIFKNKSFVRIHRSVIINKAYVKTILRDSKNHRYSVVMANDDEVEISFLKKDAILAELTS